MNIITMSLVLSLAACALPVPHNKHVETQHLCPPGCECTLKRDGVRVTCKLADKGEVPRVVPPNTAYLDLSHNPYLIVNGESFLNRNLSKLRTLDISSSELDSIGPGAFRPLKKLLTILLDNNQLSEEEFEKLLLDLKDRTYVVLHASGNIFDCADMKEKHSQWHIQCAAGGTTNRSLPKKVTVVSPTTKMTTAWFSTTTSSQTKEKMTSTTPVEVQTSTPAGTSKRVTEKTTPVKVQTSTPAGTSEMVKDTTPIVGNEETEGGHDTKLTWMFYSSIGMIVMIILGVAGGVIYCKKWKKKGAVSFQSVPTRDSVSNDGAVVGGNEVGGDDEE